MSRRKDETPEEYRARHTAEERERRKDPEYLAKLTAYKQTDEYRARHAARERERRKTKQVQAYDREYKRGYRDKNREQVRAYGREYMRQRRAQMRADGINPNNPPEKQREYSATYRIRNPKKILFHAAKYNSVKRGFEFTITPDDIVWPTHCPVLGIELDYSGSGEKYKRRNAASFDRWDGTKGYVPGNVFVISWRANWLKHDGTPDELEAVARYARHGLTLSIS